MLIGRRALNRIITVFNNQFGCKGPLIAWQMMAACNMFTFRVRITIILIYFILFINMFVILT